MTENLQTQTESAGALKIKEYVARIQKGEPKESIYQGLSPAFIAGIEAGLQQKAESMEPSNPEQEIADLVATVAEGRKDAVQNLYKNLLASIKYPDSRKTLAEALFQDVYNSYRIAEYPIDPEEEVVWEQYLKSTHIPVNNKKSEWMYRGVMPAHGEETVTRGSLNVHVTPALIDGLDTLITSGKIKANYKFGQPGTTASPTERHDAISLYFLETPSDESLTEIAELIKPYVRGNSLLGTQIAEGFFMSEVGSVENAHIKTLIATLETMDPALGKAIYAYTSPQPGKGTELKMSEAQFYSIQKVTHAFGYELTYSNDSGFTLNSTLRS